VQTRGGVGVTKAMQFAANFSTGVQFAKVKKLK
jgi:hypothetical protein